MYRQMTKRAGRVNKIVSKWNVAATDSRTPSCGQC